MNSVSNIATLYLLFHHQDEFYQAAQKNGDSALDEQVRWYHLYNNTDDDNVL